MCNNLYNIMSCFDSIFQMAGITPTTKNEEAAVIQPGFVVTVGVVICSLSKVETSAMVQKVSISLSNNGRDFSEDAEVVIFDSRGCVTCDKSGCYIKVCICG